MWIETRTGRDVRAVNIVHAHGDIAGPRSLAPSPSASEPVPASIPALPDYVVHDGVRHVPIDVLPWDVVTLRTVCGLDLAADEDVSGEVIACEWCRRFEE
jgi:hypothetical protein